MNCVESRGFQLSPPPPQVFVWLFFSSRLLGLYIANTSTVVGNGNDCFKRHRPFTRAYGKLASALVSADAHAYTCAYVYACVCGCAHAHAYANTYTRADAYTNLYSC